MISYSTFKESVTTTKRVSMVHLQQMKPLEFIDFAVGVKSKLGGKLKDIPVALKIDGGGFRVGRDAAGKVFVESSRSGPVYDVGSFAQFTRDKGKDEESISRAAHYDDMLHWFKQWGWLAKLENDTKIVLEILYNPMAEIVKDKIKFVSINYDKAKLGSLMTLVPFDVLIASTGDTHPNKDIILKSMRAQSSSQVKIVDPKLAVSEIDVSAQIKFVDLITPQVVELIQSRKHTDKAAKQAWIDAIQIAKDELAEYLLSHPNIIGKDMLGPDIEGMVFEIGGKSVKVTTPEFKASKKG